MKRTIPYTYLIGWSFNDKWYYGVRYANNCHPNELWKTYFTSSKYVKQYVKENGEPDLIQVRRIFMSKNKAHKWENTVLVKLDVIHKDKWLNKTDNISIDPTVLSGCKKGNKNHMFGKLGELHPCYGRKHTVDEINKIRLALSGKNNPMFGKSHRVVTCPVCKKTGSVNMMKRWHFENCKPRSNKSCYKRTKYISIFLNLVTNEYEYSSMVDFSKSHQLNYDSMKVYFNKGLSYKNWIRI